MPFSRASSNVITGGILLHLPLGSLYSWGCIQPYVTSYIRLHHPLVTAKDTAIIYSCACLGQSLTMPLVGLLQFNIGLRGCAAFGASLVALATLASSLATTVRDLAVLNSMFGVGIAFAYTCPLVSGYAWMPDHKGLISGFIVAGFGAGAAVFNGVATAWVNPDNVSPDPITGYYREEIAGRVPGMYVVLGTCYLALGMLGSWMLSPPPPHFVQETTSNYVRLTSNGPPSPKNSNNDAASGAMPPAIDYNGINKEFHNTDVNIGVNELRELQRTSVPQKKLLETTEQQETYNTEAISGGGGVGYHPVATRAVTTHVSLRAGIGNIQELADGANASPVDDEMGVVDTNGLRLQGAGGKVMQQQFGVWDVLREVDFYHLALSMLLTGVSGIFIAGNYKHIAQEGFPNADRFLSIMGSVASLFNASGRIAGGLAVDRFGGFAALVFMSTTLAGLLLTLGVAQSSRPAFFIAVCLVHMLYGSNFAIYPTLTANIFGASTAGPNYGLVFMGFGLGSSVIMMWLTGITRNQDVFLACAGLSFSGALSVALLWVRRRCRRKTSPPYE